jgi:hypothetical protein
MGSVFHDVQVPDYTASGLSISGLLVTDQTARQQFSAHPDDQLPAALLPGPAISRRTFSRNDVVSMFAEIYDSSASRNLRRIEVVSTLVGEDGVPAVSSRESVDGTADAGVKSSRIPIAKQIALKDVRPGRYVLRVEARVPGGAANPVVRETPVTVIP